MAGINGLRRLAAACKCVLFWFADACGESLKTRLVSAAIHTVVYTIQ